jgi:hypothetical protein
LDLWLDLLDPLTATHSQRSRSSHVVCLVAAFKPSVPLPLDSPTVPVHQPQQFSTHQLSATTTITRRLTLVSPICRSRSYFTTDSQSVCLGVEPTLGLATRYYFLLLSCLCGVSSLMRGRVCNLQCNHSMFRVAQNP